MSGNKTTTPATADTPRKTAARRQLAKAEAIKAIQIAKQHGRISFEWRVVSASEAETGEGWIHWFGQIVAVHREAPDEESVTGLLVRYDDDCEELIEALQHFPPVPDLMEITDLFEVRNIVVTQPRARGLMQTKLPPAVQRLATEVNQKGTTTTTTPRSALELPPRPVPTKRQRDDGPPDWFIEFANQQEKINASLLSKHAREPDQTAQIHQPYHVDGVAHFSSDDETEDESSDSEPRKRRAPRGLTATRVAKARAKTMFVAPGGDEEDGILVPKTILPADEILYPHLIIKMLKTRGSAEVYNAFDLRVGKEGVPISTTGSDIVRLLMLQFRCFLQLAATAPGSEELELLGYSIVCAIMAQLHIPEGAEATGRFVDLVESQITKKTLNTAAPGFRPTRKYSAPHAPAGGKQQFPKPKQQKATATKKRSFRGRRP